MNETDAAAFRIDRYLTKEALMNLLYFRCANSLLEPVWNRNYVARVQITLSYRRHSWGPRQAEVLIAADGHWRNPDPGRQ